MFSDTTTLDASGVQKAPKMELAEDSDIDISEMEEDEAMSNTVAEDEEEENVKPSSPAAAGKVPCKSLLSQPRREL